MLKHWNFRGVQTALLLTVITVLAGGICLQAVESKMTKDEVKNLVVNAKTAQDHERLAAHFTAKADELDAEAKDHTELAATYRDHPTGQDQKHTMSGKTAGHCDYFAKSLHSAALEARKLAADHAEMAKEVK